MFGKSVYLSTFQHTKDALKADNTKLYFTSLHISEEFDEQYETRVRELFGLLKEKQATVIADISPKGLKNLHMEHLGEFIEALGGSILRIDYGFSKEEILKAAEKVPIALNASTRDFELAAELQAIGAKVYAIHNFYPRPETGLDEEFFRERNEALWEMGMEPAAFMTGDGDLRGPIYEGLPTLESHRYQPPFVQYAQLKLREQVSMILVGDPNLSDEQERMIRRLEEDDILQIPVKLDVKYEKLLGRVWTVREDSPRWLARVKESREYSCFGERIEPENCMARPKGSITIDNEKYLRYSGEIQVIKEELPACEKVNVIGSVEPEYLGLLELLNRGRKFEFVNIVKEN